MFQIFKELTERIQDKKEQPDKKKEKLTFDEFAELFQQCPIPEVEYTEHFKAFIQTLEVEDEGFKDDLKKCYALCSYRLDRVLGAKPEETETKPETSPETKQETKPEGQTNPVPVPEVKPEAKPETKMTGGSHLPACITSIRLKKIAAKKRDEVFREITG
jgi:hypothetical protein